MVRTLVGRVSVDSGLLVVVDPAHLTPHGRLVPCLGSRDGRSAYQGVGSTGNQLGTDPWRLAVVVGTAVGDGIFPVYVERTADGHHHVVIDLDEHLWDAEDGRVIQPIDDVIRGAA